MKTKFEMNQKRRFEKSKFIKNGFTLQIPIEKNKQLIN